MLAAVPFTDEVCAAVATLHPGEVEAAVGVGHATLSALLLAVPQAVALLFEARLLLAASRARRALPLSLAAGAATLLAAAAWPAALPLAVVALSLSQGVACGIGQAAIVREAADPERAMARWATGGALGDLAGPLLCAAVAWAGGGWRAAFVVTAALLAAHALAARDVPPAFDDDEDVPDGLAALVRALRADPRLAGALLATTVCTLLDEILVVFGVLWLEERGVPAPARDLAFAGFALGLTAGTALVEPLLARVGARALSITAGVACTLAYAAWLADPEPWRLALVGLFAGPLYPLAEARAYATASPSLVAAASRVTSVLEVLAPLLVGLVADRFGLRAALLLLLAEPVVLGAVAWREKEA